MKSKQKFFKLGIFTTLSIFLSIQVLGAFAFVRPAHAQIVAITQKNPVVEALLSVGKVGIMTGISHFTRKIAYDTAKYIGSGGKGQSAQFFTEGFGAYLKNTAGDAVGHTIDAIGSQTGVNLCQFPDLKLQAGFLANFQTQLEIGLAPEETFSKPACDWQKFSDIWLNPDTLDRVQAELGVSGVLQMYSNSLSPLNNDFGVALTQVRLVEKKVGEATKAAELTRVEGNGVKPVEGKISGKIQTPSFFTQEEAKSLTTRDTLKNAQTQTAGLYAADEAAILPMALGVFVNTLASTLLNKTLSQGLFSDKPGGGGSLSGVTDFYAENVINNKNAVEKAFNFLFTAVPSKQLSAYDILSEFTACSDVPGINNCVIDNDFRQALERSNLGEPLTIKQAMEEGLLKREWQLYSPLRSADNTDPNCREKGYCYSNIQKLRKVRVLPLGFEIAALKSDLDAPWTLGEVVDGFYDKTKPFYKLINPNWVLRLPQVRCESKVNGPILATKNGDTRREECVDLSTCITEGPNGECVDEKYYAYCTKEKNTWHIGTNTCEPQFNTCKTFVNTKGAATSYLSRTVDAASCSAEEVGCTVFSLERDGSVWTDSDSVDLTRKKLGQNQVIHFNSNSLNQSCPPESDGCTAFYTVAKNVAGLYQKTGTQLNLKKAPDYLGCYDTNLATVAIDYPQNKVQLNALLSKQTSACLNYAQVCLETELGCQQYSPTAGGASVPGIVGQNACNSECAGYDAYKQEATQFTQSQYPLYFIPSQADQCQAQYAGCSEFTNLQNENSEYYSQIKYCEVPNDTNQKTFYSWEGDKVSGYVLKTHVLRPMIKLDNTYIINLNISPTIPNISKFFDVGSPAYADTSKEEILKNYTTCNEVTYNNLIKGLPEAADPDCRAIYDDKGTVFYRLLKKTITVSDQCQTLRKTNPEFYVDSTLTEVTSCIAQGGSFDATTKVCQRCLGGGTFKDGSCIYQAIANESTSCPATANNCREFSGNTGKNIAVIDSADFEALGGTAESISQELEPWKSNGKIAIAAESLQVGLKSLQVQASTLTWTIDSASTLQSDDWFELTFWSRGVSQNITIDLEADGKVVDSFTKDIQTGAQKAISLSDSWKAHRIGPIQLKGEPKNLKVIFKANSTDTYFLDTVRLKKLTDTSFLIKDSWKEKNGGNDVPTSCDAISTDIFPGKTLGCTAYNDVDGRTITAVGFEQLCRQKAIGCTPLVDTHNTVAGPNAQKINLYKTACILTDGAVNSVTTCAITYKDEVLGQCNVQIANDRCLVDVIAVDTNADVTNLDALAGVEITKSTVVIPADNLETLPVFLTTNPQYRCSEQHLGCMIVSQQQKNIAGTQDASYTFSSDIALKNNPDKYIGTGGILCSENSVGCGEFKTDTGVTYFRDPLQTGNALCVYQERNEIDGNSISGWFKKDVGHCATDATILCREDSSETDCGAVGQCTNIGKISCYDNFVEPGGDYGIWSNKSAQYQGLVGECPIESNTCTELVDPQDISDAHPTGKPYYVLFNDDIKDKISQCSGGVSLEEGCVLFNRTELPNKSFNSKLTYLSSAKVNGKPVAPNGGNAQDLPDTNIILKVDRDRACSEWLSCKTSITQVNEVGIPQKLCVDFRACDQVENGVCLNWTDTDIGKEFISQDLYQSRDTSWYGEEYTGYSLYNKFQITNYDFLNIGDKDYVVYKMDKAYFKDADNKEFSCLDIKTGLPKPDWETSCGFAKTGRCYSGDCVFPIDGPFPTATNSTTTVAIAAKDLAECKAYPEKNSPFSPNIALGNSQVKDDKKIVEYTSRKNGFENANICQGSECSCEYTKVQYKNSPALNYWSKEDSKNIFPNICVGGSQEGSICVTSDDCGTGTCSPIAKKQTHVGFKGYCLERDLSRLISGGLDSDGNAQYACLTWLPIEVSASGFDNYNNFQEAGYLPAVDSSDVQGGQLGGEVYCLDSAAGGNSILNDKLNPLEALGWINSSGPFDLKYGYNDPTPGEPDFEIYEETLEKKATTKYGMQSWVSTKIKKFTENHGDPYHEQVGINNTIVGFVDDTKFFTNFMKNITDSTFNLVKKGDYDCSVSKDGSGKYMNIEDADGSKSLDYAYRLCNTLHYTTSIANSDISSYDVFSLPNYSSINIQQLKRMYFSPFIMPIMFDGSSDGRYLAYKYDVYNSIYLDFDEVDQKVKGGEPFIYSIAGARQSYHTGEKYKVYQNKKITDNGTRYVSIVVLDSVTEIEVKDKMNEYLNNNNISSGKSVGFIHTAIIVEINKNGNIILDGKRPFKVLDPIVSLYSANNFAFMDSEYNKINGHSVVASTLVFRSFCTELVSVHNDILAVSDSQNKAFTNRTWKHSVSTILQNIFNINSKVSIETPIRPAGSLNIKSSELDSTSAKTAVFGDINGSGMPYACNQPIFSLTGFSVLKNQSCLALSKDNGVEGYDSEFKTLIFQNTFINTVNKLFAKILTIVKKDPTTGIYKITEGVDNSKSIITTYPPRIYSINPANCFDETKKGCGVGDWDNITINGRNGTRLDYNQDGVSDEDPQANGQHEAIIARKSIGAVMNFFAAVDDDQLPIKRVMIDWGDSDVPQNVNRYGLYKNHKPYCQADDATVQPNLGYCADKNNKNILFPTVTCNTNFGNEDCNTLGSLGNENIKNEIFECVAINNLTKDNLDTIQKEKGSFINEPRFGNAPRACQPDYFEYTHSFTCPSGDEYQKTVQELVDTDVISEKTRVRLATLNVGNNDKVCVFKPKVQILDNWGYCNGDCGSGAVDGCYGNSLEEGNRHCEYNQAEKLGVSPWTEYQGQIIIIPN